MCRNTFVAILVSGIAVGSATLARAQEPARPDGVSAGTFSSASVSLSPAVDNVKGRQWVGGGLTLEVPFGQTWSIDARALRNWRGARLPVPGTTAYQDISSDYVSMPLLVKAGVRF